MEPSLNLTELYMRYSRVIIHGPEFIDMDVMEFFLPEYFLYHSDPVEWKIYEEFKDTYHIFKIFNN